MAMPINPRTRFDSVFGIMVTTLLAKRGWTQEKLARKCQSSISQINQVIIGRRTPLPYWVDKITVAMKLNQKETMALNWAAATILGYKIGDIKTVRFLRGGTIAMPAMEDDQDDEDDDYLYREGYQVVDNEDPAPELRSGREEVPVL